MGDAPNAGSQPAPSTDLEAAILSPPSSTLDDLRRVLVWRRVEAGLLCSFGSFVLEAGTTGWRVRFARIDIEHNMSSNICKGFMIPQDFDGDDASREKFSQEKAMEILAEEISRAKTAFLSLSPLDKLAALHASMQSLRSQVQDRYETMHSLGIADSELAKMYRSTIDAFDRGIENLGGKIDSELAKKAAAESAKNEDTGHG